MITVLVADDDALVRGGIAMLLTGATDVRVVGEAAAGEETLRLARELRPDVVLMDLKMPGLDGVEATRRLTQDGFGDADAPVKVLVLTTFNDDASVYGSLRAGASGFLVKDRAPVDLLEAIRQVAAGHAWLDPSVARQVIRAINDVPWAGETSSEVVARLTSREREVLALMAHGLSNAEISERLVISDATVRTHVSRILMKTGSRDRTQAVVLAYQSGLVRAPNP